MMTTPLLNLIFMQGFNLDLELPSCNDCLIILCEMIIQACVPTAGGKKKKVEFWEENEDTGRLFILFYYLVIYWPCGQIQISTVSEKNDER